METGPWLVADNPWPHTLAEMFGGGGGVLTVLEVPKPESVTSRLRERNIFVYLE